MFQKQKETILTLLKSDEIKRNYEKEYWIPYKDFLDPADGFTAFSCENLEEKQKYLALIDSLFHADETAKVFVEVYGFEEDIFPSDIGEVTDFSRQIFLVGGNGDVVPVKISDDGCFVYFCWWD